LRVSVADVRNGGDGEGNAAERLCMTRPLSSFSRPRRRRIRGPNGLSLGRPWSRVWRADPESAREGGLRQAAQLVTDERLERLRRRCHGLSLRPFLAGARLGTPATAPRKNGSA
jgi:hypothetical protein